MRELKDIRCRGSSERGFTITELLISATLGIMLGGAIVTIFVENRRGFDQEEMVMRMQDDARQAVRELSRDLSMAGFWADLVIPAAVSLDDSLVVGTDCGPAGAVNWVYQPVTAGTDLSHSLLAVDNATGATASSNFGCIDSAEILAGTDVVAIKRVAGTEWTEPTNTNTVYFRTNGTVGMLFREPANTPPVVNLLPPFSHWEYRPSIYYIRNYANFSGDGIPTLCRKMLDYSGTPVMATDCIAQGVEDLQLEYGFDSDGDGRPNVYLNAPTITQMQAVVAVRVYLLARSTEADPRYTNDKTYQFSNGDTYVPADNFYRRVYSFTVGLRNLRALASFQG